MKLKGENLILFVDALIEAPVYGAYLEEGHKYDQFVFDNYGGVAAFSIKEWFELFLEKGEHEIFH